MATEFVHDAQAGRYEVLIDGERVGFADAREEGDKVVFPHTEIDERFEGRGLARQLVTFALDDVRARGKQVEPHCTYVKRFIDRNAEYQDLLAK